MNSEEFCKITATYIKKDIPFFFLIDFEKKKPVAIPLYQCAAEEVYFEFSESLSKTSNPDIPLYYNPIKFQEYAKSFNIVKEAIHHGDSFLVNLTYPSPVSTEATLIEIYKQSKALYRLYYKNKFVVFSPESFIQIRNNRISTYPMKGTIMASIPNAESLLLNNPKEQWEHNTIVDLMRNDLSMVADNVEVVRFRYISEILTHKGKMLQTSSEISGDLQKGWQENFGHLLLRMLPAGSISGAPKDKTTAIIKAAEPDCRQYYTGIFGIYNKGQVDSAVAIRYIERNEKNQLTYRSGGGITFMSQAEEEYEELINKIYIPTR